MDRVVTRCSEPVVPRVLYEVSIAAFARGTGPKPPAVLAIAFLDRAGRPCPEPVPGLTDSALFGPYRYLGRPGQNGRLAEKVGVHAPRDAVRMRVTLIHWNCTSLEVADAPSITLVPPPGLTPAQAAFLSPRLLAVSARDVAPGEPLRLTVRFAGETVPDSRAVLVAVQFTDAFGAALAPSGDLAISEAIGAFRYLSPRPDTGGPLADTVVTPPTGARKVTAQVLRWSPGQDLITENIHLGIALASEAAIASGRSAIKGGAPFRLTALLHPDPRHSDPPLLAELEFRNGDDHPVTSPGAPVALSRPATTLDGKAGALCRTGLWYHAPSEAAFLHWRLRPSDTSSAPVLAGPVHVGPEVESPTGKVALLASEARCNLIEPAEAVEGMRAFQDGSSTWTSMARGELVLLAEWAAPVQPDGWVLLSGRISRRLPPDTLVLCPVYFDAEGRPLTNVRPLGCTRTSLTGPARPAFLRDDDASPYFAEAFRTPEGANRLLVRAFEWPALVDIPTETVRVTSVALRPVTPDEIGGDLVPTEMSHLQLRCAVQLADAVDHLPSRHALHSALAAYETRPGPHGAQALRIAADLDVLDPAFLPDLPAPTAPPAAAGKVTLCLAPGIAPGDAGDTARRTAALFAERALVCLPLGPDCTGRPDGLHREGSAVRPVFSGWNPASLPPTDRICLEAQVFDQMLRETGADIVHAIAEHDLGAALIGLALARHHGRPFVLERTGFFEHAWRPADAQSLGNSRTRLHLRQYARLMHAADMLIVPSLEMKQALAPLIQDAQKIAVVPPCLSSAFREPPGSPPGAFRARRGLAGGTKLVGLTPDPARPDAEIQALEAVRTLLSRGIDLHVVILGSATIPAIFGTGTDSITVTGPLEERERRDWTECLDLVLVTPRADPRSDFTPPLAALEALACGVPVICTDRPFASGLVTLAGDLVSRSKDDTDALTQAIEAQLARPGVPPERGQEIYLRLSANHDLEHVRQTLADAHAEARRRCATMPRS